MQQVAGHAPSSSQRGRYLVDAADCAALPHRADGGAPFAGGVPLHSPFGTIHGTNITPDPEHGIGRYTADDFFHALTRGEARDGHQLYPAMPYVSYRTITRADSDAIYAYLMNQPAVNAAQSQQRRALPRQHPHRAARLEPAVRGARSALRVAGRSPRTGSAVATWSRRWATAANATARAACSGRSIAIARSPATASWAASPRPTSRRRAWPRAAGMRRRCSEYLATGVSAHAVASDEMLQRGRTCRPAG